ncbi:MAG TPA: TRAM domain-containing protein [Thermomicrobiales bacterium]|nr:TRAM domain-containing protein [Thermomicrobiales bacterium]
MQDGDPQGRIGRSPFDRVLRYVGLVIGGLIGWQIGSEIGGTQEDVHWAAYAALIACVLGGIAFIITPYVTVGLFRWLRRKLSEIPAIDIVAAGIGLIIGGILSSILALPSALLPDPLGQIMPFVVAVCVCVLSVLVMIVQKNELLPLLTRRGGPVMPEERLLLDTSVIIDGRIVELMRSRIVNFPLVVPGFILRELQGIANSDDPSRKVRGRRGLDVLERLQREGIASVEMLEVEVEEEQAVDNKLIRLAKLSRYHILTGDQNLERVAKLQDVVAININTVAQAMRPPVAPGEELELSIVQAGREHGQGIGYLDDGTLVVIEEGRDRIGKQVRVVVTRTLQTGTGRMAFAQVKEEVPVG